MTEFDDDIIEPVEEPQAQANRKYTAELHKRWFAFSGMRGFISITPWRKTKESNVGKLTIDIGMTEPEAQKGNTVVFVDAVEFLAYLRAVNNGTGPALYPGWGKVPPESLTVYGGNPKLSRVFKAAYKNLKDGGTDSSVFVWKAGNFEPLPDRDDNGAIQPNWDKPISTNQIQVTRQEINLLVTKLEILLAGWAATDPDGWWDHERK